MLRKTKIAALYSVGNAIKAFVQNGDPAQLGYLSKYVLIGVISTSAIP